MNSAEQAIELMAPVGSWESLVAAFQAGAGAVYFGIENLNMRSQSSINFTLNDLPQIVEKCHAQGVKAYLTLNTVMFDDDLSLLHTLVDAAAQCGVDALIASDPAVLLYGRQVGMELHASTQLNIANTEAVRFYAQFCDVMVLAREVCLPQVKHIHEAIVRERITGPSGNLVRIEMFCHGALCMAVSGKCYLSLHEYNRSANRGACVQVCRRQYTVTDNETGASLGIDNSYIMSPKDLCTIGFLNKLLDSGVTVLKIEGRARAPEYVKTVTDCYREAIAAYQKGTYNDEKIQAWRERLSTVFNRGFWNGYYLGQRLGEWSHHYGSSATTQKVHIGKCTNYFSKLGVGEFVIETGKLCVGDKILITGPTTGVVEDEVRELRLELSPVERVEKGAIMSMPVSKPIRRSDKLYKICALS